MLVTNYLIHHSLHQLTTSLLFDFRSKLDPNREILEAAQGNTLAKKVYREFHSAISEAKKTVKRGVIFDFHGQVKYIFSAFHFDENII